MYKTFSVLAAVSVILGVVVGCEHPSSDPKDDSTIREVTIRVDNHGRVFADGERVALSYLPRYIGRMLGDDAANFVFEAADEAPMGLLSDIQQSLPLRNVASVRYRKTDTFGSRDLQDVENLIGATESAIEGTYGLPDEQGTNANKDAVVWTYLVRLPGESGEEIGITGYRQVAFWNGRVASVSSKWIRTEPEVTDIYKSTLAYMGQGNRTIARGGGFDRRIFTDSLRISRRGDNLWMVDMLRDGRNSQATLLVGDAGYHMCRSAMEMEAKRIEAKFGIDVTNLVDSSEVTTARRHPASL